MAMTGKCLCGAVHYVAEGAAIVIVAIASV